MNGKKRGKSRPIEVQVCPRCLSSKISRLGASSGDMTGAIAILPPKYACSECGWVGRLVIMRNVEASQGNDTDDLADERKIT